MTRKEQIEKACNKIFKESDPRTDIRGLLYQAAEWADANPKEVICIDDRAELIKLKDKLFIAVEALTCIRFQASPGSMGNKELIFKLADEACNKIIEQPEKESKDKAKKLSDL